MSVSYYIEPMYTCCCCKFYRSSFGSVSKYCTTRSIVVPYLLCRTVHGLAHTSRRHRYGSVLFPNTTVERFDNIDEIMRRLVGTPVNLSGLENTMRSMRDTLRYIESAWMYHGSSPDLINDVCVSLQRGGYDRRTCESKCTAKQSSDRWE